MTDDNVMSNNHSKSVKFRLRVQQEHEATAAIREYKDEAIDEEYYKEADASKKIQD